MYEIGFDGPDNEHFARIRATRRLCPFDSWLTLLRVQLTVMVLLRQLSLGRQAQNVTPENKPYALRVQPRQVLKMADVLLFAQSSVWVTI